MEALEHPSPLVAAVNALLAPLGWHVPDYLVFCALIVLIVLAVGLAIRAKLSVDNPSRLQIILEDITTFIVSQLDNAIGEGKGRKYMAICGGVFVFILIGAAYSAFGAFYALLFYLWNAYFRPEVWAWNSTIAALNLSFVIGTYAAARW